MSTNTIPLHLFQTWHTKNLEPAMKKCVESLTLQNKTCKKIEMDF